MDAMNMKQEALVLDEYARAGGVPVFLHALSFFSYGTTYLPLSVYCSDYLMSNYRIAHDMGG